MRRQTLVPVSIIILLFAALYYPIFSNLFYDWNTNPDYSHGYFIPFIVGYMIYSKRQELKSITVVPNNWGFIIFVLGIAQLILGIIGAEHFLQSTSMIIVIIGIVLFVAGVKFVRILLVPIFYIIFMIPLPAIIWNNFAFSLRLFASKIAVICMHAMGMLVLREGNMLYLPGASLEVVDACSGMRSLVSLLALGALFAFISKQSVWKKWILFLSAIPIAIISNIIRLIITVALVQWFGLEMASGTIHEVSGLVVFCIGLILFFIVYKLISIGSKAVI